VKEYRGAVFTLIEVISHVERLLGTEDIRELAVITVDQEEVGLALNIGAVLWP